MALKCRCICGCKLLVAPDSAGKRIKCPKCERKLRVPVDLVEKRRTQLESRKPRPQATPPRSKIEKPLSALVDLPEPDPPPIQLDVSDPIVARAQPREPVEKAESPRKPPPLPTRGEDRADVPSVRTDREKPAEPSEGKIAPSLLPAEGESAPLSDGEPEANEAPNESRLETDDVELPVQGYSADRDKVATVRWLAAAVLLTGLVGTVPAIIDVVELALSDSSGGLSRWACALFLVGLLHGAYALYLVQLPDWSSVWIVTFFTLAVAASYAAMFGMLLLASDQNHFVQIFDLADRLHGGKATAWCLIMLSLLSLTSYFSGRVGARWRNAFVG